MLTVLRKHKILLYAMQYLAFSNASMLFRDLTVHIRLSLKLKQRYKNEES
jgi:hypothetical protein